ncbi:MAG TPA: prenyltransferase/squalene oxidase repeat-containing protein [Planctomycetota bacterium]|nr:prenyltransferase/squalene oxidase repeat-containing protein [Planctomycetota bacterium]
MPESAEDRLEKNIGRLVETWAEGLHPEALDRARKTFLAGVKSAPVLSPDASLPLAVNRRRGLSIVAASLGFLALVLGVISFDSLKPSDVPGTAPEAAQELSDEERRRIRTLIEELGNQDIQKRDAAETQLLELGDKAKPMLEEAVRDKDGLSERILVEIGNPRRPPVFEALLWLGQHQDPDGSWSSHTFSNRCTGGPCSGPGAKGFTAGVTGLSLMAFLGAGYSQLSHDKYLTRQSPRRVISFGDVVKKALQWLQSRQAPDGSIGISGPKAMYNHVIAAAALCEAYGMTASQVLKAPAQKSIDFLVASQTPGKGWRYTPNCGESDSSITGWAVMALKSAELSDLEFPKSAYEGAVSWFEEVTVPGPPHSVGYTKKGPDGVSRQGKEGFGPHPTMEALATMARIFMVKKKNPLDLAAARLVTADMPEWKPNKIDFVYWHWATLAVFQVEGPDGPMWKAWNEPARDNLILHQRGPKDGCAAGSWDPEEDRWGSEGGRVYAVAINTLTLEVHYRYTNTFKK